MITVAYRHRSLEAAVGKSALATEATYERVRATFGREDALAVANVAQVISAVSS